MERETGALELVGLSIDARDPLSLAPFWAAALRWDVDDRDPSAVALVPTDGTGFPVVLRAAASVAPAPGRYHLDVTTTSVEDRDATVTRLLELGGHHHDVGQGPDESHVVLADPEGNALCIIEPGNRFLGDCGRLGAVNGDGTEAVGRFWSEALGWPLIWDQDGETAIRAPGPTGPIIAWGGPPVAPKEGRNRLHLDLAPAPGADPAVALDRLVALGARTIDLGRDDGVRTVLADPDDNEFCLLHP